METSGLGGTKSGESSRRSVAGCVVMFSPRALFALVGCDDLFGGPFHSPRDSADVVIPRHPRPAGLADPRAFSCIIDEPDDGGCDVEPTAARTKSFRRLSAPSMGSTSQSPSSGSSMMQLNARGSARPAGRG